VCNFKLLTKKEKKYTVRYFTFFVVVVYYNIYLCKSCESCSLRPFALIYTFPKTRFHIPFETNALSCHGQVFFLSCVMQRLVFRLVSLSIFFPFYCRGGLQRRRLKLLGTRIISRDITHHKYIGRKFKYFKTFF